MQIKEFQELVDRWGSRVERWPEPQRQQAVSLLEQSEEARIILAEAARIEGLAKPEVKAPPGLADRIVTAALGSEAEPAASAETGAAGKAKRLRPKQAAAGRSKKR